MVVAVAVARPPRLKSTSMLGRWEPNLLGRSEARTFFYRYERARNESKCHAPAR